MLRVGLVEFIDSSSSDETDVWAYTNKNDLKLSTNFFYHYTSFDNYCQIIRSKKLMPSNNTIKDCQFGVGIYFTTVLPAPENSKSDIILNNYGKETKLNENNVDYFIRIPIPSIINKNIYRIPNIKRNIWLMSTKKSLNLTNENSNSNNNNNSINNSNHGNKNNINAQISCPKCNFMKLCKCKKCKGNKSYNINCNDCNGTGLFKLRGYRECRSCDGEGTIDFICSRTKCTQGKIQKICPRIECNDHNKLYDIDILSFGFDIDLFGLNNNSNNIESNKYNENGKCKLCNGNNWYFITCVRCHGNYIDTQNCNDCRGTGNYNYKRKTHCRRCDGDGILKFNCNECNKDGKQKCDGCKGYGVLSIEKLNFNLEIN